MKEFRKGELRTLKSGTRVVYTAFLAFAFASYVVMAAMAIQRAGLSPGSMVAYYVGDEVAGRYGKTYGELIELTHFHLFSIPLFLLVQGHIFILSSWPQRLKAGIVVASFVAAALYIAGPWLVLYVAPGTAVLGAIGRLVLGACLLLYFIVPIREMWIPKTQPGDRRKRGETHA